MNSFEDLFAIDAAEHGDGNFDDCAHQWHKGPTAATAIELENLVKMKLIIIKMKIRIHQFASENVVYE